MAQNYHTHQPGDPNNQMGLQVNNHVQFMMRMKNGKTKPVMTKMLKDISAQPNLHVGTSNEKV